MHILDIKSYTPAEFKGLKTWAGFDTPPKCSKIGRATNKIKTAFSGSGVGYINLFNPCEFNHIQRIKALIKT